MMVYFDRIIVEELTTLISLIVMLTKSVMSVTIVHMSRTKTRMIMMEMARGMSVIPMMTMMEFVS